MPEYVSFDQFRDRVHGAKLGDEVDRCYPEHETRAAVMNAARGASPVGGAGPVATSRPARREAFAAELDKMLGYLRRYYHAAGAAEHTFLDPGGNFVDCIPFGEVPSVRAARAAGAAAVADHGPRLSGFEPRPQRRGFERPPTPGRVVPLLRQGLVDRFGKRLACPDGCVPVARLSVDDMARSGSFDQFFSKIGTRPPAGKKAAGRKAGAKPGTKAGKKAGARVSPRGG